MGASTVSQTTDRTTWLDDSLLLTSTSAGASTTAPDGPSNSAQNALATTSGQAAGAITGAPVFCARLSFGRGLFVVEAKENEITRGRCEKWAVVSLHAMGRGAGKREESAGLKMTVNELSRAKKCQVAILDGSLDGIYPQLG